MSTEAIRSIDVSAPLDIVYGVITDFTRYPAFLSEVEACRVQAQDGDVWDVEYTIDVVKRLSYKLRMRLERPSRMAWELISGELFTRNEGHWKLEALDGGRKTRATYAISLDLALFLPRAVQRKLSEQALPATLREFKAEAERRAGERA
jgi:ribosome-associated toxin RatA of RatAB toxin-antitoxin module